MKNGIFYKSIFPKKKILIVGIYPPPLGGVSVHIYRLIKLLRNNDYSVDCFDVSKKQIFKGHIYIRLFYKIIFGNYNIIHLHENDVRIFKLFLVINGIFPKIEFYLTVHNSWLLKTNSKWRKKTSIRFLSKIDVLIVVGKHILDDYKANNVLLPQRVFVKHAFLAPPIEEEEKILSTYPRALNNFLNNHKPIITANAFQVSYYNKEDLYGLDMCIELTAKIKLIFPNIGFVFALANDSANISYLEEMKCKIEELGVKNNFYFLTGQRELWPLFKKVNLMVRPTSSDGFGISISEALFFSCPAIASNVCERPTGTIIFENRNLNDLTEKCITILKQ